MATAPEPLLLDYGATDTWAKHPLLWRLTLGLLMVAACAWAVVPWLLGLPGWWTVPSTADGRIALGALGLGGIGLTLHALTCDGWHVQRVGLHAHGLNIVWSHVPHLFGARVESARAGTLERHGSS